VTDDLAVNGRQGQKIDCRCRDCRRITKHEIVSEATLSSSSTRGYEINWADEYQIVRCLGCESLCFRRAVGSDDDIVQIGEDKWEYQPREDLYPDPYEGRQPLTDAELLPNSVSRIYDETLRALNFNQEVLCGIGIRAIVETVCKDKKAAGKDLKSKIDALIALGVLTKDGADILHQLRTLGNRSAHEVKPHSKEELGLAFDVIDHLLLGVYILPVQAKRTFDRAGRSRERGGKGPSKK
jgi:hypothetical protein